MKSSILFIGLVAGIIATVNGDQEIRITRLDPIGFKVEAGHVEHIVKVEVSGKIFEQGTAEGGEGEEFSGDMILENNWWVYRNVTATVNPGDTITYAIINRTDGGLIYDDIDDFILDEYQFPSNATQTSA